MKTLTLSIKREFFDKILSGEKTHEYREIRPKNGEKYFRYEFKGKEYVSAEDIPDEEWDEETPINLVPVKYDAIKLLTGAYSGKRPYMVVEVKNAEVVIETDEEGNDIVYEQNGEEYLAAYMDYELGEVLEKNLEP